MAKEFKVGDIVQLKSGGPKMTVDAVDDAMGETSVLCVWFAGAKQERARVSPDSLILASEEKPTK